MSGIWSHLTCPPQPPFPVRISDDVFLPVPSPTSLRTSFSEPSLNFELKGLKVLTTEDGDKDVVKVSETKMKRRSTLLMTPGEVHKLRTLSFVPSQIAPTGSSTKKRSAVPKTPQPRRRVASDMSTPSTCSRYSSDSDDTEYDTCSSSVSTPCSKGKEYISSHDASSPCPMQSSSEMLSDTFVSKERCIEGLPIRNSSDKFSYWRSPRSTAQNGSSPFHEKNDNVKRRRISQIEWEGMPCPEELVSPRTKQRISELGHGLTWTSFS
ncbi:uncharacterized protein IL334_001540 [Kwoniella shivajii]|uniref:Uncharacterized protein n=1 Tax=Kwoniella shivajii TaxID=564305 RepID=A0ABZ1CTD2_9TREE|nr:hypothetical protein IL334_001540 [Kwoniella shivajii]